MNETKFIKISSDNKTTLVTQYEEPLAINKKILMESFTEDLKHIVLPLNATEVLIVPRMSVERQVSDGVIISTQVNEWKPPIVLSLLGSIRLKGLFVPLPTPVAEREPELRRHLILSTYNASTTETLREQAVDALDIDKQWKPPSRMVLIHVFSMPNPFLFAYSLETFQLYRLPMGNIFRDGRVCLGDHRSTSLSQLSSMEQVFSAKNVILQALSENSWNGDAGSYSFESSEWNFVKKTMIIAPGTLDFRSPRSDYRWERDLVQLSPNLPWLKSALSSLGLV